MTGDGAFAVAAPLLAATLTTDPVALSVVSASAALPWLLFGLPAGALVDRWPRRRVMVASDLARAVVLAVFVVLLSTGHATVVVLAAAVLLLGIGQCFFDSSAQGMIPAVVGRDKVALTQVNGRFWALDTAGRSLAGPALGSALFAAARMLPFVLDALSFLLSAILVRRLPETTPLATPRAGLGSAIREGFAYVWRRRTLRTLVVSTCANNGAFSIAMATFVLYAGQSLHVPPAGYGALLAITAVGGVLAGWWAKPLTRRLPYLPLLSIACLGQALAWTGIAAVRTIWFTGLMLALLGAVAAIGSVVIGSARQEGTPDELLGRVVSVFRLFGTGTATFGALLGGVLAAAWGLAAPMYVAALVLVIAGTATAVVRR
ncbi:MFS transporter [Couchioplanes caeruleus subsp. azureus]|nr:MFS transporter [Couchioplanes caeruleus subsp. azureus]